jgi:hypothetical protein
MECSLKVHSGHSTLHVRVAKCYGYDGYIRVKILAGWGKSLGEHAIWKNQAFFGEASYNVQHERFMGIN